MNLATFVNGDQAGLKTLDFSPNLLVQGSKTYLYLLIYFLVELML